MEALRVELIKTTTLKILRQLSHTPRVLTSTTFILVKFRQFPVVFPNLQSHGFALVSNSTYTKSNATRLLQENKISLTDVHVPNLFSNFAAFAG